jgi:arylsulfatase A-like enzyme
LPPEFHQTQWVGDKSIEAIRKHDTGSPLFMWTSFVDPHHPFNAPRKYVEIYRNVDIPEPVARAGEHDARPEHLRRQGACGYWPGGGEEHSFSSEQVRHIRRNYYAMVTFIDEQIGRIREALEEKGMLENTLIVFTSDHGELLGDHGLIFKGPWHYECAIRVPMIFRGPGVPHGRRTCALMENVDILPTLLEFMGTEAPYGVQGFGQRRAFEGKGLRESVVSAYNIHDRGIRLKTLRTERHKLNVFAGEKYGELYDLEEDPNELYNRFFEAGMREVRAELFERLAHRLMQDEDPLPERKVAW